VNKQRLNACISRIAATLWKIYCVAAWSLICDAKVQFGHRPNWLSWKGRASMLVAILNFLRAWKRYNASLNELYRLGDRELADIGITRSDIPRIAWDDANR
jgi:uncharacterized protein YjiS (DUF1127 family)